MVVMDGLFEVVADDLRPMRQRVREGVLEPVGEAMVELGAKQFGDGPVSRLLDEDMAEAVLLHGPGPGRPRLYQALGHEGLEIAGERVACLGRKQLSNCLHAEVLTDDGRAGQHAAGSRSEALQARGEQSLDRRGQYR